MLQFAFGVAALVVAFRRFCRWSCQIRFDEFFVEVLGEPDLRWPHRSKNFSSLIIGSMASFSIRLRDLLISRAFSFFDFGPTQPEGPLGLLSLGFSMRLEFVIWPVSSLSLSFLRKTCLSELFRLFHQVRWHAIWIRSPSTTDCICPSSIRARRTSIRAVLPDSVCRHGISLLWIDSHGLRYTSVLSVFSGLIPPSMGKSSVSDSFHV